MSRGKLLLPINISNCKSKTVDGKFVKKTTVTVIQDVISGILTYINALLIFRSSFVLVDVISVSQLLFRGDLEKYKTCYYVC